MDSNNSYYLSSAKKNEKQEYSKNYGAPAFSSDSQYRQPNNWNDSPPKQRYQLNSSNSHPSFMEPGRVGPLPTYEANSNPGSQFSRNLEAAGFMPNQTFSEKPIHSLFMNNKAESFGQEYSDCDDEPYLNDNQGSYSNYNPTKQLNQQNLSDRSDYRTGSLVNRPSPLRSNERKAPTIEEAEKYLRKCINPDTEPSQYFRNTFKNLHMQNQTFQDKLFPATPKSLEGNSPEKKFDEYGWKRLPDLFPNGQFEVFVEGIEPNDVIQCALGHCYYVAVLSSFAEWPSRVRKLFVTTKVNSVGMYCVKLYDMGKLTEVIIDDRFPYNKGTNELDFTKTKGEIWVQLLEKAWAKTSGSFWAIEGGFANQAMHVLTPAPTEDFLTNNLGQKELIWEKLMDGERMHYLMTCSTSNKMSNFLQKQTGLVKGHVYSVLAAYEIKGKDEKWRIVKVRNPHGNGESVLHSSFNSFLDDLSAKQKQQLDINDENQKNGIFVMLYKYFLEYFEDVQFCYYSDLDIYNYLEFESSPSKTCWFELRVTQPGQYYIIVNQESSRKHAGDKSFSYPEVFIHLLTDGNSGNSKHITENTEKNERVWVKSMLQEGHYTVQVSIKWGSKESRKFVLGTYGPSTTVITRRP